MPFQCWEQFVLSRSAMRPLNNVSWDECILALRRAGFVQAAESPSNVMLVSAGRTVLLQRVAILEETALDDALRSAGLGRPQFRALLAEGIAKVGETL
jgi:hypothetical protein